VARLWLGRRSRRGRSSWANLGALDFSRRVLHPIKSRIAVQIQALLLADRRLETARGTSLRVDRPVKMKAREQTGRARRRS
jgi:hypothetical protein